MILKTAIVGVGYWGPNYARIFNELETAELCYCCDLDEKNLKKIKNLYPIVRTTKDLKEVVESPDIDVIVITTPLNTHYKIAKYCLENKKHLLVEKPFVSKTKEGEELIEIAKRNNLTLMVGHVFEYNPGIRKLKEIITDRKLGEIYYINAERFGLGPIRKQANALWDLATHDIDVMRYLLGSEVERVYAEIERKAHESCEDLLSGSLRFSNGVIGVLDVNWLTPTKVRQLAVLGEGGMYLADYLIQDVYWYKNSRVASTWDTLRVFRGVWEGDMVKIHIQKKEPLRVELESFVAAVLEDREPEVNGQDGLIALDVAQKLIESGTKHVPIYLKVEGE